MIIKRYCFCPAGGSALKCCLNRDFLDSKPLYYFMRFMESQKTYLLADAEHPILCKDQISEEMILYNIKGDIALELFTEYERICGKSISFDTQLSVLSGGQKVLLMALLALYSPAGAIRFLHLQHSLDESKAEALDELFTKSKKSIVLDEES